MLRVQLELLAHEPLLANEPLVASKSKSRILLVAGSHGSRVMHDSRLPNSIPHVKPE